jgi:hypothetical protein
MCLAMGDYSPVCSTGQNAGKHTVAFNAFLTLWEFLSWATLSSGFTQSGWFSVGTTDVKHCVAGMQVQECEIV